MELTKIIVYFCVISSSCKCYKILAVFPQPIYSHYILTSKLVDVLVDRGHEVTFITAYPREKVTENLKEVSVASILASGNEEKKKLLGIVSQSLLGKTRFLSNVGNVITKKFFENENIQNLLHSNEQFDIVLIHELVSPGLLAVGHHFQAPIVLFSSMPNFPWSSFRLADPSSSSYVPNNLLGYTGKMNFWQRMVNVFSDGFVILYDQLVSLPKQRELVKKYVPGSPDLYQFLYNISLVLINSHMSSFEALPQIPNFVEIGGFHIEETKQLPKDLQVFLDNSNNGVVLFSMGSNLKTSDLPEVKRNAILGAFAKLKQNVLWKWETDELPGKPQNVKTMKWIPQVDVLAHPNIKAFITHGGLLSTMESIYHAVPVIGIPMFSDQRMNVALAGSYGYAVEVQFENLTEEVLLNALEEVLNNGRYKENVKKRSLIMRDRPLNPRDTAAYWIEYVARHRGAPHLKYPGADLRWFQRQLIDVFLVSAFILLIFLYLVYVVIKKLFQITVKQEIKSKKE